MECKRYNYLDVAKGVGILLVISGHLFQYGGKLSSIIFSFHMPLFFFISGMLFRSEGGGSFSSFVRKKAKRLLVPYVIVYLIGGMISYAVPQWRTGINFRVILAEMYYVQPESFHVGQIWFLVCLFFVEILFYFYHRFIIKKFCWLVQGIFLGAIAFVGTNIGILNQYMPYGRLPFKWDTALIALIFYALGYILKNIINDESYLKNISVAIPVLIVFTVSVSWKFNGWVNIASLIYNHVFLYFFNAICGILLILAIGKFLHKVKILQFIGRNSLVIFSLHSLVIYLYTAILSVRYKIQIVNGSNVSWKQSIAGALFVTGIMLLVVWSINKLKRSRKIFTI